MNQEDKEALKEFLTGVMIVVVVLVVFILIVVLLASV